MKTISQTYYQYIYEGTISYDEDMSYEYNEKWEEEVRRMRENKNIKNKKREE